MNIEIPLKSSEFISNNVCQDDQFSVGSFASSAQSNVIDVRSPYRLLLGPEGRSIRYLYTNDLSLSSHSRGSRFITESLDASTAVRRTSHSVSARGGRLWRRQVDSVGITGVSAIRCTRFSKAKAKSVPEQEWSLDLQDAARRPLETELCLSEGKNDARGLTRNGPGENEPSVTLVTARILTDHWIELLLEDHLTASHRLIVMWQATTGILKRWRASPGVHIRTADNGKGDPGIIVDEGRGFVSLGTDMSDRNLLAMVMVHSGATTADQLCNMNQMDRCTIPLRALEASLTHRQLDTVSFYLTSSLNAVDHWLKRYAEVLDTVVEKNVNMVSNDELDNNRDLGAITRDLQDAVGLILSYMTNLRKDDACRKNEQYCQQLTYMLNSYLIKMLTKAVAAGDVGVAEEASVLLKDLQNCLHELYSKLKTFMDYKAAEKGQKTSSLETMVSTDPALDMASQFYSDWDRFDRTEVIVDGLVKNAVPLMVEYLIQRKVPVSVAEIQRIGLTEVRERLRRGEWHDACYIVLQMGLEVRHCFEDILWETGVIPTRDFLLRELSERLMLSPELQSIWEKIERLETIYSSHNFHSFRLYRVARAMLPMAGKASVGSRVRLLLSTRTSAVSQVPRHRGAQLLASQEAEVEIAEAAWMTDVTSNLDLDDPNDDDESSRERAVSLSGHRGAYHRFRLFALRHVTDTVITRMLIDQAEDAEIRSYLEEGLVEPLTRYLMDYVDVARLMELMTPEMAPLALSWRHFLPAQQREMLDSFLANEFNLFDSKGAAQPFLRLSRFLRSELLVSVLRAHPDLIGFVVDRLVQTESVVALQLFVDIVRPPQNEDFSGPIWAQVAITFGAKDSTTWDLCRVLLRTSKKDLGAILAAALISDRPIDVVLDEWSTQAGLASRNLSVLHGPNQIESSASVSDLYALLNGCLGLLMDQVFGWQKNFPLADQYSCGHQMLQRPPRPHFSEPRLIERLGNRERLSFQFYLLHRRPIFAFLSLLLSATSRHNVKSARFDHRRREAASWAHQLAIENSADLPLVSACLAFVTLVLPEDAKKLRAHLMCLNALRQWRRATQPTGMAPAAAVLSVEAAIRGYVDLLCTFCVGSTRHMEAEVATGHCLELDRLVADYESAVLWRHAQKSKVPENFTDLLLAWTEVLNFVQLHKLHPPCGLLEHFASKGDWLGLLATSQLFPFGKADLRCVLSRFNDKGLRDHLSRVIDKALPLNTLLEAPERKPSSVHPSPIQQPRPSSANKRDPRRALYNTVGVDIRRAVVSGTGHSAVSPKGLNATSPTKISPEMLNTHVVASSIDSQSRESDSLAATYSSSEEEFHYMKLQSAIEALSTNSLFELLLTVRSPRTLLAYSIALSHPLLAILAICTATDPRLSDRQGNRISYFCGFIVASLPYKTKDFYLETWDGRIIVDWDIEKATELIQETIHRHSFRELEDAMHIFMPKNPLYFYLSLIRIALEFRNVEKLEHALSQFCKASKHWLDMVGALHVTADGMNESEEETLTRNVIGGSVGWVCTEILREQSPQVLLTVVSGLSNPLLASLFVRDQKETYPLESVRRLLQVLLDCYLPVDSSNLLIDNRVGLTQTCSEFALQLVSKRRFREARRVLDAGGPAAGLEVVRRDVERAEAEETTRQRQRFSPKLNVALDRVMKGALTEAPVRMRSSSSFSRRHEPDYYRSVTDEPPEVASDLLFLPVPSIAWRPTEECFTEGPWRKEVDRLLDAGRLELAYRVLKEAGNELYHEDLVLLLYAVQLARHSVVVEDLPEAMLFTMTQRRVRPSMGSRRPRLASMPVAPFGLNFLGAPQAAGTPKKGHEVKPTPQNAASVLQTLPLCVNHGREIGERIYMMHRVAQAVDAPYEMVLQRPPLAVLCKILAGTIVDKVAIAELFVQARRPPENALCRFLFRVVLMLLRQELAKADAAAAGTTTVVPTALVPGRDALDFQVELPSEIEADLAQLSRSFSAKMPTATALEPKALLRVAHRPFVLGELFLDTLRRFLAHSTGRDKELGLLVELLVLAQECMELAGSTEGIADCLRVAGQLTRELNAAEQYRLLVRLLTGMRRYGEMNYIFGILLEKQCMEVLLSKEATKNERFKIALIEYLKRHRPKDTETWDMVLAFFSMTRESAESKEVMAASMMRRWVRSFANSVVQEKLEQPAMTLLYATNDYLSLRCYRRAKRCFRRAQLCALQSRIKDTRLIDAPQERIMTWLTGHSEFYEAFVVCQSAGMSSRPWPTVLWEQVIVRGDAKYLDKFMGYLPLHRGLVLELARRFRNWCAAESLKPNASAAAPKSQAGQRRQQFLQHFRLVLRACEDQPLVLQLCHEFGLQPTAL